jgi:hypothetical protein
MDTEGNKIKHLNAEELASLARRYYSARFPNPQRLGCPPPDEIIKVVRHRQIPDQAMREHLFECSECFGEYRQSLEQRQAPATDETSWRDRLAWIRNQMHSAGAWKLWAAAASVVLVLSSLILIWPEPAPEAAKEAGAISSSPETNAQARTGDGAISGAGSASNQIADGGIAGIQKPQGPQAEDLAMVGALRPSNNSARGLKTIDVDLDNYQAFRQSPGESGADVSEDRPDKGGKVVSLPATHTMVVLRLPESGAPGRYQVSLIDPFGKSLLSTSASSRDGAILRVPLNLRRMSNRKCRLRLSRNGEAPAFYDVIIAVR